MTWESGIPLALWALLLAYADWRTRRLPNLLLLAGLAWGAAHVVAHGVTPWGATPGSAALTALVALIVLWPVYAAGWMGAGDVKLLAVIGWLGGLPVLLSVFVLASLLSGGLALFLLVPGGERWLAGAAAGATARRRVPFGLGVAGALLAQLGGGLEPFVPGWLAELGHA